MLKFFTAKRSLLAVTTRVITPLAGLLLAGAVQAQDVDFSGDLRFGYYGFERDERNGSETDDDMLRLRVRAGLLWTINDTWSVKGRYAARMHSKNNDSGFVNLFDGLQPGASSIEPGESTLDEFYVRARYGNWDHRIGRFQTNARLIGVAEKSFSRTNSTSWDVGYTDGVETTYRSEHGYNYTALIEYNDPDGTANLRRSPLAFQDSSSRASYYLAVNAADTDGLWAQRSLDVTYIPSALYYNGVGQPQKRDYLGFSGRLATQMAVRGATRLVTGVELAWAPETQLEQVAGLPGSGKTDSFSWHVSANLMDFMPGHSIALVYGENEAGWLLSTDFQNNSTLTELRYAWEPMNGHLLEARVRERKDLHQLLSAQRKRSETDVYFRYSITI